MPKPWTKRKEFGDTRDGKRSHTCLVCAKKKAVDEAARRAALRDRGEGPERKRPKIVTLEMTLLGLMELLEQYVMTAETREFVVALQDFEGFKEMVNAEELMKMLITTDLWEVSNYRWM